MKVVTDRAWLLVDELLGAKAEAVLIGSRHRGQTPTVRLHKIGLEPDGPWWRALSDAGTPIPV